MARKPRVHSKNAVYHVIMRGAPERPLFHTAGDRTAFLQYLQVGAERYGHQVFAYCLQKDQVNLVIKVGDTPLSKCIQNLSFRYTRHYNQRHDTEGPLFEGRYRSVLIDPSRYLLDLIRFVHLEPARRRRGADPTRHKSSSYRAYLEPATPTWLSIEPVLNRFGSTTKKAVRAFERFHAEGIGDSDYDNFVRGGDGGQVLGTRSFQRKVLEAKPVARPKTTLSAAARHICRQEGVTEAALKTASRARDVSMMRQLIACVVVDLGIASLTDVSQRYDRDLTTMSRNQRYFRDKMKVDGALRKKVVQYQRALS